VSNGALASYTFLPWLRRGLAARIARQDVAGGSPAPRAELPLALSLDTSDGPKVATADLALIGPGEVKSLDPRVIIRRFPRPGEADAQPNYFAHVEFDQPDFPWRHTAARANDGDRLRPWLVLVVLTEDEIESREPPTADGQLPAIHVGSSASLPDLAQSWAWAHVQISALGPGEVASILSILDTQPHRAIARLLCPRRLVPRMRYVAFLTPAFERGRRAALKESLDDAVDALQPAWTDAGSPARQPVYEEWRFTTGAAGDFEFLVRQLMPWPAPATLGIRDMDVSDPGMGLPPAAPRPLQMEGALMSPLARAARVDGVAASAPFVAALRTLVNAPADLLERGGEPVVAPPLYGRWYAAQDRLTPGSPPVWFNDMNADPRFRAAGGLGTAAVQAEQQQLMASAWEQVQGILELNEKYRQAQLARELTERVRQRHLAPLDAETGLLVSAPLHTRIRTSPDTIRAVLRRSPIAGGVGEGQLRRLMRPLGPVGRRQGRRPQAGPPTLLQRMNRGELNPAPRPATPREIGTPGRLGRDAAPGWLTADRLARLPRWLGVLAVLLLLAALALPAGGGSRLSMLMLAAVALGGAIWAHGTLPAARLRTALSRGVLDPDDIRRVPAAAGFVPSERAPGSPGRPTAAPGPPAAPGTAPRPATSPEPATTPMAREAITNFRVALAELHRRLGTPPETPPPLVPASLPQLREKVLAAVDPQVTIALPLRARTRLAPWVAWEYRADPIEPPMPAPRFDQPMYEPLRDLSQDWILPGAGEMPANTVSLLETNQRLIEAYLVGCNHEMTRELRYHEYPIDQRGTYFRQFWDVRGYVPDPGQTLDAETLRDIKPVHAWPRAAGLGANSARRPPPGGAHLVLVVKGEVFRRYPNTIVYACHARIGGSADGANQGKRILSDEQKHPVFRGRLDPDIRFFGFELSAAQARGSSSRDPGADQGWFFVLQEQVSEPLFGLDLPEGYGRPITSWDDLSWGDLVLGPDELTGFTYIDLDADLPDTALVPSSSGAVWHADRGRGATGATAADLAYITLQRPFRVAMHGADLLPPAGA
jgi:hypothetical protein